MKVEWDYSDNAYPVQSIVEEVNRLPELTEQAEKKVFNDIGKIIVTHVKALLPPSGRDGLSNYDGSQPYVDMRDDIKSTVKRKDGFVSLIVRGGKKTGYKWHLLDDGTRNPNGTTHTSAKHFTDKAMRNAEAEIDKYIDQIISEVANGK